MKMMERFTYRILTVLSRRLRRLSFIARSRLANRFAVIAFYQISVRKTLAAKNIQLAFPEKSKAWVVATLKQCYTHFAINFIQFLALPNSFNNYSFSVIGRNYFDQAIAQNKGVILITGHFGLWEMLGAWLGLNGYPCYGIITRQKNRGGDKFIKGIREQNGMHHIYRKGVRDSMYKVLQDRNVLILASDQDARSHGIFVEFFKQPTSTPKGAAIFHLRTKSPMVFCTTRLEGSEAVIEFEPVSINGKATIESITQTYTTQLEEKIRRNPEQYFWFHRKWKTQPRERKNE